jgi:hypothetical protein
MPSFFRRFVRIGQLPEPMRAELAPEGIVHVAERVPVSQRFSGSAPGVHSAMSVIRLCVPHARGSRADLITP